MKKLVGVLLTVLFVLSALTGCSGKKEDIEVVVPASFFAENADKTEISEEQKKYGVKQAVENEDGSVTYVMSGEAYELMNSLFANRVESKLYDLVNSEEYESIKDIKYSSDFSRLVFYVDSQAYVSGEDALGVTEVCMQIYMYQIFSGVAEDDAKTYLSIVDYETEKILSSGVYPEKNS